MNRRSFLQHTSMVGASSVLGGATFAEMLEQTARQTAGPFYPDRLPLDRNNDLVIVDDRVTPAIGTITHVSGRILTTTGEPIRNALVEIWQVDAKGRYLHSDDRRNRARDANFQGYGRFDTASDGAYRFRTIRPVRYGFRTPHIHFAVTAKGRPHFATQMYVAGEPGNRSDSILNAVRDEGARARLICCARSCPSFGSGRARRHVRYSARLRLVAALTPPKGIHPFHASFSPILSYEPFSCLYSSPGFSDDFLRQRKR